MFRSLNEEVALVVRQQKLGKVYGELLQLSWDLGVDFEALLRELVVMDRELLKEEKPEPVVNKVEPKVVKNK